MARTKLEINKDEFQKVVNDLEAKTDFDNPSSLWKAVEASDWAKSQLPRPMTASVAYMRARELGITYKAKPGKAGRGNPNLASVPRGPRVSRSEKFKKFTKCFQLMRKETPERYELTITKIEAGSMKAAVKLKCLECSNFQPREVKECVCEGCSLFPFRPFQNKKV